VLILVCCIPVLADPPGDIEINDTPPDAATTGLVDNGTVAIVGGTLGYQQIPPLNDQVDCRDVYRLDVTTAGLPKLLTVSAVGSPTLDGYIRLFYLADEASGEVIEIAYNDDHGTLNGDPTLDTYLLDAGTYYVAMSPAALRYYDLNDSDLLCCNYYSGWVPPQGWYGTYDLTIVVESAPAPASTFEPNDVGNPSTDLGTLGDGGSVYVFGEFIGDGPNGRSDVDRYVVTLTAPSIVQVDAAVEHMGSTLMPSLHSGGVGAVGGWDSPDARLEMAVPNAGDFYVCVAGTEGPGMSFWGSGPPATVGYYDFSITATSFPVGGGPFEPNESILEAATTGLAGAGQVTLSAHLGDGPAAAVRSDVDSYSVAAAEGQQLTVDVDAAVNGSGLDSVVVVYDYLGKEVARNDNDGVTTDSFVSAVAHQPTPDTPATLYVMILGTRQVRPADPLVGHLPHLVIHGAPSTGPYDVTFTLSNSLNCLPVPMPPPAPVPPLTEHRSRRLFATDLAFPTNNIVELDPWDGSVLGSFAMPEPTVLAGQGLAPFNQQLFYLGAGRFPVLYRLDPDSGDVAGSVPLWSGSGLYGDIALVGNRLFVTDILDGSLHEFDAWTLEAVRTIEVASSIGAALGGPLASLAGPNRLYLADGTPARGIHVLNPVTGGLDTSITAAFPCPCQADFDGDGDVDAEDVAFFDNCDVNDNTVRFDCRQTDLDCDGDHDTDDEAILLCQQAGSGVPPNPDCCSSGLPDATLRATALGASGCDRLYVHDRLEDSIRVYDPEGNLANAFPTLSSLGAVGGQPFLLFGDANIDGEVRLGDFAPFVDCLTGPGAGPLVDACQTFDSEPDNDVDLDDFAAFQIVLSGGSQP